MVSGPDSGGVWNLAHGDHVVGRSGGICWNDPSMSRRHAALHVTSAGVEITDLRSRHGTALDRAPCSSDERVPIPTGATLEIGHSVAVLRETQAADGAWERAAPGWRRLLRPPRLQTHVEVPTIDLPEPPRTPEKRGLPAVAIAVPLAVGVGIAVVMRRPEYLLFALASPVMVLANHAAARVGVARRFATLSAAHADELEEARRQVTIAVEAEQQELRQQQPDAAATLLTAVRPGRRLWERRPGDPDFLRLRLGSADQASRVRVNGDGSCDRVARLVPQCVDLASVSVLGIVGEGAATDGILRWQIGQLAAHHAPDDLSLVFLGLGADEDWAWLHWLPHLRAEIGTMAGTDPVTIGSLVAAVKGVIRLRRERRGPTPAEPDRGAVVVVVRGYGDVARVADLREIVEEGPGLGVHLVCSARVDSELPEQTSAVLTVDSARAAQGSLVRAGRPVAAIRLEQVSTRWAERLARGLAPFEGASRAGTAAPETVHLFDLLQCEPRPAEVADRWRAQPRSTHVTLGVSAEGPLSLDLRGDGPHALVAGMTGSGKTELLQTVIASLAIGNHPHWLNFVLIDYKGDSAFQECARLPHAVGKVTDLDGALVQRVLTSLRAELDRRKAVLADAGVKDIDDYCRWWSRDRDRAPLPRLVLVIDEFAELAKELPDFVDGLVTIAQLGRSLGVHLILATQRPSGVLSPAIRANTNIRIALRVADPADSTDVMGNADASLIAASRPGCGYLRLGAQGATQFQAARVHGPRTSSGTTAPARPVIAPLRWRDTDQASPAGEVDESLATLVDCLRIAAEAEGVPLQRRPWLDPLPATLPWSRRDLASSPERLQLPFGLSDLPARQCQETACFDLDRDGHLYFVGAPRSGRTQVLRVLAAAIGELTSPEELHVYAIDGGAGGLDWLASLPHCGAVVARREAERVGRLLARLTAELDRRQAEGAVGGRVSPRLVLMLDGWDGLMPGFAETADHLDAVMRLLREGAGVGIHLVITGDRTLLTNTRMSAMTEAKYVLRLTEKTDYALAGISARQINGEMPPGRCFGPGMRETQVFLLDVEPTPKQPGSGPRPFRVDPLPSRVSVAEAVALLPREVPGPWPIVGVGGDELVAFAPEVARSRCFAVVGPPRSGRSSVLAGAIESAALTGAEVVVVASHGSPLRRFEGQAGVLAVIAPDAAQDVVEAAVAQGSAGSRLLVIDDADELRASPLDPYLLAVAGGRIPGLFLMVAGSAEGLGYGLSGWRAELRKANQGLLLSPRGVGDGELIGARLTRNLVGGPIRPGLGLLHTGGSVLTTVTTLALEDELLVNAELRKSDVCH